MKGVRITTGGNVDTCIVEADIGLVPVDIPEITRASANGGGIWGRVKRDVSILDQIGAIEVT